MPNGVFMITSFGSNVFDIIYGTDSLQKAVKTLNLISIFDPTAQFLAIFLIPRFSRRSIFLSGYSMVALIQIAITITDLKNLDTLAMILIISLAVFTSITQEPV